MQNLQQIASNPEFSCWVNASAGTGKTKVLIDRILRLLIKGCDPEKIVCLTFSKAAANEMLERLEKKIKIFNEATNEEIKKELEYIGEQFTEQKITKVKALINNKNVKIQTLHSFCNHLLNNFSEDFFKNSPRIMEIFEEKTYLSYAFKKLLEKEELQYLLEDFLIFHNESVLFEYLCRSKKNNHNLNETVILKRLKELFDIQEKPNFPAPDKEILQKTYEIFKIKINDFEKIEISDSFSQIFLTQKGTARKKILNKEFKETEIIFKCFAEKLEHYFTQKSRYNQMQKSLCFWKLQKEFQNIYETIKKEKNLWDFNDLISKTLETFETDIFDEKILYLNYNIQHILIDEAQDTSVEQWEIIKYLVKGITQLKNTNNTLFVVGDEKQLIYSFQGAEIKTFENTRKEFAKIFSHWKEIDLNTSFRSAQKILDLVDSIFTKEQLTDKQIKHYAYFKNNGHLETLPLVEIMNYEHEEWPIFKEIKEYQSTENEVAKQIVDHIKKLKTPYKDVMILMRKRSNLMQAFEKELQRQSIPYNANNPINLLDKLIVQDLLSIVEFINMPLNELNLAALLKIPLMQKIKHLKEEEIFNLCYKRGKNLWQIVQEKLPLQANFLQNLLNLNLDNEYKAFLTAYDLIDSNDIYLNSFMEEVFKRHNYMNIGTRDLLDNIYEFPPYFSNNIINTEGLNLLTVHGAKGLEAKTVFILDNGDKPNLKQDICIFDPVLNFWLLKPSQQNDTILTSYLKEYQQKTLENEHKRLLYVALTRAKERLIIGGIQHANHEYSWYFKAFEFINKP